MKKIFGALSILALLTSNLSFSQTDTVSASTHPGQNGQIYYLSPGESYPSNNSIHRINSDGTNDTALISNALGFNLSSSASSKIVYEEYVGMTEQRLVVANQDGSNPVAIPLPNLDFGFQHGLDSFRFSFLGDSAIVFSAADTTTGDVNIYRVNLDGTGLTKITTATPSVNNRYANPSVSPLGDKMIVGSGGSSVSGPDNILVMDMSGNVLSSITPSSFSEVDYGWNPNGQQIIITEFDASVSETATAIYNISGSTATIAYTLQPNNVATTNIFDAVFSPDGSYIAFMARETGSTIFDEAYLWTIPTASPGGSAQQLIGVGAQLRGSGGNSWIDWRALPLPEENTPPVVSTPVAPNAPGTGFGGSDGTQKAILATSITLVISCLLFIISAKLSTQRQR